MLGKPPDTIVHQAEPFNAEPPAAALAGAPITPLERFYASHECREVTCLYHDVNHAIERAVEGGGGFDEGDASPETLDWFL